NGLQPAAPVLDQRRTIKRAKNPHVFIGDMFGYTQLIRRGAAIKPDTVYRAQALRFSGLVYQMVQSQHFQFIHLASPWPAVDLLPPPVIHRCRTHQGGTRVGWFEAAWRKDTPMQIVETTGLETGAFKKRSGRIE